MNSSGDRHEPWGTPAVIFLVVDIFPSTLIMYVLLERKDLIMATSFSGLSSLSNLRSCAIIYQKLFRSLEKPLPSFTLY